MQLRYLVCSLAIAAALLPASRLDAQGIGYSVTPTVNFLRWDDDLGIRNSYLYGGRIAFEFGPALSLGGYYLTRQGVETDAAAAFPDAPLPDRELNISHFGADMTLSLGTGGFVPFLRGGGGVLRLHPEDGRRTDQVVLKGGGGLRLGLVRGIQGEIFVEDWIFRINRNRLFVPADPDVPLPPDPEFEDLRHNLAVGLGVRVPFGGDPDHQDGWLRGAAIPIEPFIGRLHFDDDLALADQNLLGIRSGVDLTRHVGVRGYYWRGTTSDFTDTQPVQSYGGEVQFNLNTGPGVSPYLVAGVGQLDFGAGFVDEQEQPRADETMLILGGGLSLGLSERLRVNLALRDHLLTVGALEDAARLDDLFHNWMLSAGLTFSLGGTTAPARMAPTEREQLRAEVERLRRENERLREQREREREQRLGAERALAAEGTDTIIVERDAEFETERVREVRVREGERQITLPIPTHGEILIRYGTPRPGEVEGVSGIERIQVQSGAEGSGALSSDEIRALIREALREELRREGLAPQSAAPPAGAPRAVAPGPAAAPLTDERLAQIEQRLAERVEAVVLQRSGAIDPVTRQQTVVVPERSAAGAALATEQRLDLLEQRWMARMDALVEQRMREEVERQRRIEGVAPAPVTEQTLIPLETAPAAPLSVPPPVDPPPPPTAARVRRPLTMDPERTRVFTGVSFAAPQALLGARLNFGPVTSGIPLDLVPEITFGFGDGTSLLLAGNLQYETGPLTSGSLLTPYVNGGPGLLTAEGLVLNLGYGVLANVGRTRWGSVTGFAEHHGVDLYRIHRLLAGVRLRL